MKKFSILFLAFLAACSSNPSANEIVDQAIEASGTDRLQDAAVSFIFRSIEYSYEKEKGSFNYTRIQKDSIGNEVKDILTNDGLTRYINRDPVEITDERRAAYTSSVNSVIYFAFLPMPLNDAAVNKTYVGQIDINDKSYHKIKVTFDSEGGGEDHEDVFYYWFDINDYSLDYLAYSYNEDDGVGVRFREAFNSRLVNGVIIQDYRNYKPENEEGFPLETMDKTFENGDLKLLSVIELEEVEIKL